jgi:branched-subunit amino acid aminotransferase/4-amino-4-deoxychorismate lyase
VIDRRPHGRAVLCGTVVESDALLLPWFDPATQWGLGVFETIAVGDGAPRFLDDHLRRLSTAAARLGVRLPAAAELSRAARLVAEDASSGRAWLKILVSRSGEWAVFAGPLDPADEGRAVSAVVLAWRRHRLDPTAGIKSTSFAASILGLEEARQRGADEGLWLNERGHVIEASTGNVFVVRGRAVVTPALGDGARDGVTRERAIEAIREFGLSVRQSKVRIATLRGADEVFLTSSLRGVRPVVRIDGRNVRGGDPGPISLRLANWLSDHSTSHDAVGDGERRRGA